MYTVDKINLKYGKKLEKVYGDKKNEAAIRITKMVNEFFKLYGEGDFSVFSVPGRTEICGNHTDHNNGKVACASINLDIIAIARKVEGNIIRLKSEGYDEDVVDISDLRVHEDNFGKSSALIEGVVAGIKEKGFNVGAFCAYTTSKILKGSGLSSSAAFEDMVGTIENYLYNEGKIDSVEIAKISQFSENKYFGKPCGLMDQIGCALGGFVFIDFEDKNAPKIKKVKFSPEKYGYSLYIVDTGGSHVNLTPDYASVPYEMKSVASMFGEEVLRPLKEKDIIEKASFIREKCGDRAILRAIHYMRENARVDSLKKALEKADIVEFLRIIRESGKSSSTLLQNLYSTQSPKEQGIPLACAIAEEIIGTDGGYRVHGGGFAGTMQVFVPKSKEKKFINIMKKVFGEKSITKLSIRPYGQIQI